MAKPASYPLDIYQGDTYRKLFRLSAKSPSGGVGDHLDLTGWTGKAQIRPNIGGSILVEFTVEIDDDQDANPGQFTISATKETMQALTVNAAVWDCEFVKGADRRTLLAGPVIITFDVTRPS